MERHVRLPTPFLDHEVKEQSAKAWKFEYRDRFGRQRVQWISKEYAKLMEDEDGNQRWHLRPFLFNRVSYFLQGKENL